MPPYGWIRCLKASSYRTELLSTPPLTSLEVAAETGQSLTYHTDSGAITATTDSGVACLQFDGGFIDVGTENMPSGDFTVSYWVKFVGSDWGDHLYAEPIQYKHR